MATTQTRIFQTGFSVENDDDTITDVRFGLTWPDGSYLMTDWSRTPKEAELEGVNITVYQNFGFKARQVTYRLFFDDRDDYRTLDTLQYRVGTLRITHNGHTLPTSLTSDKWIHTQTYSEVANVLLRSLVPIGTDPSGIVEADAVFTVIS